MTAASDPRTHKVGPYTMNVNRIQPTSANRMPLYARCTPDRWGLRYSDEEKAALAYPVARDYAKAILQALTNEVQWGDAYFGPPGSSPNLKLVWPLDQSDQLDRLNDVFRPHIAEALTRPAAGFGVPIDAVPTDIGFYTPSPDRPTGEQGAFSPNDWSLHLNANMLKPMFGIRASELAPVSRPADRADQLEPLRIFADTLYHEARHCQQWFWIYALVQQHPDNFLSMPNISQWPLALTKSALGSSDRAVAAVGLAATQPLPAEPLALISLKRMPIGQYLYVLHAWRYSKSGVYYPSFLTSARDLDDEIQRAKSEAIELLQRVGIGGNPIDVDRMVAEPSRCYCDYTARPWENDAFFCGETASAYWVVDINPNMALRTYQPDQCSRAYEMADRDRKLAALLHPHDSSIDTRTSDTDGDQ